MEIGIKNSALIAGLVKRLHNPNQLRWFLTGTLLAIGIVGVYVPLSGRADSAEKKASSEKARLALLKDVERLRDDFHGIKQRLPAKSDPNEWARYMIGGIGKVQQQAASRGAILKIVNLETLPTRKMPPYRLVTLNLHLEGEYPDLEAVLRWLDANERLLRVDTMKVSPNERGDALQMKMVIVGVIE